MTAYFMTDDELAAERAEVARMLPDTCVIQEITQTQDGAGNAIKGTAIRGTVQCRVGPVPGRSIPADVLGGKESLASLYRLWVAWDCALLAVGRLVVHGGHTYELRGLVDDTSWRLSRGGYIVRID